MNRSMGGQCQIVTQAALSSIIIISEGWNELNSDHLNGPALFFLNEFLVKIKDDKWNERLHKMRQNVQV